MGNRRRRRRVCGRSFHGLGRVPSRDGAPRRRAAAALRRRLGMDAERLRALSGVPSDGRPRDRIQRQVHGRTARAARRVVCDAGLAHPPDVPKLLPPGCAMAVLGTQTRPRRLTPAPRVVIDVRLDPRTRHRALARDVAHGLTSSPKTLPPKYFYDARGSAMFDRITELPEYYPTRAETSILKAEAARLMARLAPDELVEIGAGTGTKIRTLLDARTSTTPLRYVPVDVDGDTMTSAARALTERY